MHWLEAVHIRPLRSIALRQAERWMLERFEMSDGLAAIFPSIMNSLLKIKLKPEFYGVSGHKPEIPPHLPPSYTIAP